MFAFADIFTDLKRVEIGLDNKYIKAIEKLANGYEYEEVQTQIEETLTGTKKKITKTKKHIPPNFQAAKYLLNMNKGNNKNEDLTEENVERFNIEVF